MALLPGIQAVEGTTVPKTTTTTAPAPTTSYVTSTALRSGTTSDEVKALQQSLASGGYYTGKLDGSYGPMTLAAVKAYQTKMGLTVDGVAGPQTLGSLGLAQTGSTQSKPAAQFTPEQLAASQAQTQQEMATEEPFMPAVGAPKKPIVTQDTAYTPEQLAASQSEAEQQLAVEEPYMPPVGQPIAGGGGGGGGGPAAPSGTVPNVGLVQLPGITEGGTSTPTTPEQKEGMTQKPGDSTSEFQPQENPYLEALPEMKFEYSPFNDPEYLRRASDYEAQVAGMMVGRGGLWSSVGSSALRNGLLVMQQDMTKQKYEQFLQDRNFTFQMAQFIADQNQREFSNRMQEQEFEFAKDKEEFNRYAWQEEMNFNRSKEAFDQKMALASYNLQASSLRFNQEMARQELAAAQEAAKYDALIKLAETDLRGAQKVVLTSQVAYEKDEKAYYAMMNKWRTSGTADKYVANYFGVSTGSSISNPISMQKILDKASYLDQYKAEIGIVADSLAMDANTLFEIQDFNNTTTGGSVRKAQ